MGILDEAIREHLELKRKHGAEQGELRQLEDEAFGPAERPGEEGQPEASGLEAAETQVLSQIPAPEAESDIPSEPASEAAQDLAGEEASTAAGPPETSEREAIAQQPTQVFDVASELAREKAEEREADEVEPPQAEEAPASESAPVEPEAGDEDEATGEVAEAEPQAEQIAVPELEVPPPPPASEEEPEVAPITEAEPEPEPEAAATEPQVEAAPEPEVFDEQSLAEELDQALDGPTDREQRRAAFFEETDEFHAPPQRPARPSESPETSEHAPETSEEDVLESTPEFLEETPEHDRLWFEQKPPKDFDFND